MGLSSSSPRPVFSAGRSPSCGEGHVLRWDNCYFRMSLLLLLSDDQVCLNSWMKSCWFLTGIVKCTSKQMRLNHVLCMHVTQSNMDTSGETLIGNCASQSTLTFERPATSYGFLVMLSLLMSPSKM